MGWWGGGWGDHTPQSAKDVAEAFYAGKTRNRSSCKTDGHSYYFISSDKREVEIARRTSPEETVEQLAEAVLGRPYVKPLEFNLRGWATPTTARHFNALGLKARCIGIKKPRFTIDGRYMPDDVINKSIWFTLHDVNEWPTEHPDDAVKRLRAEERERNRNYRQGRDFVQLTPELPGLFEACAL